MLVVNFWTSGSAQMSEGHLAYPRIGIKSRIVAIADKPPSNLNADRRRDSDSFDKSFDFKI